MIAALLFSAALAANPCAERFWARDLGGLARLLAEPASKSGSCDRRFFDELAALVDCRPLPALAEGTRHPPDRLLLRVEEARRSRLAPQLESTPTIWRALADPRFFRRDTLPEGMEGDLLIWPVEAERWPGEALKPPPPRSRCAGRPAGVANELDLLSLELLERLKALADDDARWREPLARAAYHRSALLLRSGDERGAREAAELLDPAALRPPLASFAALLRAEAGLEDESTWARLAHDGRLGDARHVAVLRAAVLAARDAQWDALLALTEAPRTGPAESHLTYLRGLALARLGRKEPFFTHLREVFVDQRPEQNGPALDALRALGLAELAVAGLDDGRHQLLLALARGAEPSRTLARFSTRTLALGNVPAAKLAAAQLVASATPADKARGFALQAEIAAFTGAVDEFAAATAALLDRAESTFARSRERDQRDRAALELGHALLTRFASASPGWRRHLQGYLAALRTVVHERHSREVEELERAAKAAPTASLVPLGEVNVAGGQAPLPAAPRLVVNWPEPFSLLAIPDGEGRLRAWFEPAEGTDMNASMEGGR